jgi:hypothetical protein
MKMEQTECSETLAFKLQTLGNNPEESIRHSKHGKSLKSRSKLLVLNIWCNILSCEVLGHSDSMSVPLQPILGSLLNVEH